MSCWTKEELENMLEDVVNVLDLSESVIEKHGPAGTAPAKLVGAVLAQKDFEIRLLEIGITNASNTSITCSIKSKLQSAKSAKLQHKQSADCSEHGCTACHFWSGTISALSELTGESGVID